MTTNTAIEWADHTFNPWIGCSKISPGCDHCYAERDFDHRKHVAKWGPGNPRHRTGIATWNTPLQWNRNADKFMGEHGRRQRVFCASLADVFDNEIDPAWRVDLFELIAKTSNLDWLLLTKRIGNAHAMLNETIETMAQGINDWDYMPWPNVWIGATVVNQAEADRDIPKLAAVSAAKRFLSMEPLLESVQIAKWLDPWSCSNCGHHGSEDDTGPCMCADCGVEAVYDERLGSAKCTACDKDDSSSSDVGGSCPECGSVDRWSRDYGFLFDSSKPAQLDWVICGGESGPNARPTNPSWVRSLRDQCADADVPFMFKQWGEFAPITTSDGKTESPFGYHVDTALGFRKIGKKLAGRLLDGVEHNGFPSAVISTPATPATPATEEIVCGE